MSHKYDFVPDGMEERGGKLVPKRDDPYILIQQLKAKVKDLERRANVGEAEELQIGNADLRKINGELTQKVAELEQKLEGIQLHLDEVTKARDDLAKDAGFLKKQAKDAKSALPLPTVDMERMATLEKENADLRASLEALSQDKSPPKKSPKGG